MKHNPFHDRLVSALSAALEDDSTARMDRFREDMRSIIPKQDVVGESVMSDRELGEAYSEAMGRG